jgi:hypothetical protein
MNTTSQATRFSAFFAAAAVTTVLLGSQFGLAGRYDAQAASVLAGPSAGGQVTQAQVQRIAG